MATAVSAVLAGIFMFQTQEDPPVVSPVESSPSTEVAGSTGTSKPQTLSVDVPWALIFDDGLNGAIVVDPNLAGVQLREIEGQRPGDQPYRLELVGGSLIVGWDQIYAVDLDSGESRVLGEATIFVKAAEPERIWLIDYPGGAIGSGTPQAWQVSVSGEALTRVAEVEPEGFPAIGVAAGLALESDSGMRIWDVREGTILGTLGSGTAHVADSTFGYGSALAWCSGPCDQMHVTEIPSLDDSVFTYQAQGGFIVGGARFSGDGRYLAAPTESGDIVIFDRDSANANLAFSVAEAPTALRWSGHELFAITSGHDEDSTTVTWGNLDNGAQQAFEVPFKLGPVFVVVHEGDALSFLASPPPG